MRAQIKRVLNFRLDSFTIIDKNIRRTFFHRRQKMNISNQAHLLFELDLVLQWFYSVF